MARKAKSPTKSAAKAAAKAEAAASEPVRPGSSLAVTPLAEILVQERALATLSAAANADRLHHAWIFAGPAGVGKFTTAVGFGAALLDPTSKPDAKGLLTPEPDSEIQTLVRSGGHPDLHIVRKELASFSRDSKIRQSKQTVIALEVMREFFIEPAARTRRVNVPSRVAKVLILDEAHLLNLEGQNALLKTLEEPPAGTLMILVTANEERLLPTVRSRCQRVPFVPLNAEAMAAWLARDGSMPALPAWLAHYGAGSPGTVAWALEMNLAEWAEPMDTAIEDICRGRFRPELGSLMADLVKAWTERLASQHDQASKDVAGKSAAGEVLRLAASMVHRRLEGRAKNASAAENLVACLERIGDAERHVATNVSPQFVMDSLVADWTQMHASLTPAR